MVLKFVVAGVVALMCGLNAAAANAADSHVNYYYPQVSSQEIYNGRVSKLPGTSKRSRIGFTVGINAQQMKLGYAPGYHIFAKGAHGQKMIIVATEEQRYNTLYRLRALLASLTATARATPLFAGLKSPEDLTFLDLCKMAGFELVTITDGREITHQISID